MLKKAALFFLIGVMLISCNRGGASDTSAQKVVGISLPNITNPYYVTMKKNF